jgi:hypothetical protein
VFNTQYRSCDNNRTFFCMVIHVDVTNVWFLCLSKTSDRGDDPYD